MRPSREEWLVKAAELASERSTCSRNHVGCVVANEGRIIVTGYNGAPAGLPHCSHECDCPQTYGRGEHDQGCFSLQGCMTSVHAEANAIAYAARYGVRLEGSHLYTTVQPCLACAQLTINAGIRAVTFVREYRDHAGLNLLNQAGIVIIG